MYIQIPLEQLKAAKQGNEICPGCGSKTEEYIYEDSGEEFTGRKCKKACGWWGPE